MKIVYILIGIACQLAGWYIDRDYSKLFIYYRTKEGNTWFQDKHGFLDAKKAYLALLIEQGMAWVAFLIPYLLGYETEAYLSYMALLISIGAVHLIIAFVSLRKSMSNGRETQIKQRAGYKTRLVYDENGQPDREASIMNIMTRGLNLQGKGGRYWIPSAQFIYIDADNAGDALQPIAEKLYTWLLLPEPEDGDSVDLRKRKLLTIWGDLKFHPKADIDPSKTKKD
jgi:YD repeat-containing protein